jgi:hypothetical protein
MVSSSYYLQGLFDWVICFTAPGILEAKKFEDMLNQTYHPYVRELHLLENIFPVKRYGIQNPNLKKIKEFT